MAGEGTEPDGTAEGTGKFAGDALPHGRGGIAAEAVGLRVSEAVEETAESFRDFARSQGHLLELAIVPGLTYCGDEYAVRQLVSILLDNAVKYALPETPIRFVLEKGKRGVVLRCSNACTPLAEGETEKLFDRFYRSDQARSADGSFGVGLSIARSIAEGHHGFIRAQCPQPGEIVFTAQLR